MLQVHHTHILLTPISHLFSLLFQVTNPYLTSHCQVRLSVCYGCSYTARAPCEPETVVDPGFEN